MAESERLVAPELELLLHELATRPRSIFLRADRKAAYRSLRSGTEECVSALAIPDALERELAIVHRAELAEIVHQAIRTRLLEGARERLFIMHYRGANERAEATGLAAIRSRLGAAAEASIDEPWAGAIAALQRALAPEDPEQISVLDLAALGQRLEPRGVWRVNTALWYLAHDEHDAACELARKVLDGWPATESALRALEILAIVSSLRGSFSEAFERQEQACNLGGEYPQGGINRLRIALLRGRSAEVLDASERLEDMLDPEHPLIGESNESYGIRRQRGEWSPTVESIRVAKAMETKFGHVARRLASVYT